MFHCATRTRAASPGAAGAAAGAWRRTVASTRPSRGPSTAHSGDAWSSRSVAERASDCCRERHSASRAGSRVTRRTLAESLGPGWRCAAASDPLDLFLPRPAPRRTNAMSRPRTLGELKRSGYRSRSVKDEMRGNLIARLKAREPLFPGVVGYEHTVEPQIVNAILSDRKSTRLNLQSHVNLVCRLLLEKKKPNGKSVD